MPRPGLRMECSRQRASPVFSPLCEHLGELLPAHLASWKMLSKLPFLLLIRSVILVMLLTKEMFSSSGQSM